MNPAPRTKLPRVTSTKVAASHGSTKSGYAKDVVPDIAVAGMQGLPIPPAAESGRQEGVTPPAERKYTAKYDMLSLEEVMARTRRREKGELPPIVGGVIEAPARPKSAVKAAQPEQGAEYDPFAETADFTEPYALPGALGPLGRSSGGCCAGQRAEEPQSGLQRQEYVIPKPATASREQLYLSTRKRVMMELTDTTLRVSVIDVIVDRYGVTVLMPLTDDGGTFVPKPGSELKVVDGDRTYPCYFPGASFEIPALKLMGLTFIRMTEG